MKLGLVLLLAGGSALLAQDPFKAAGQHYHKEFENEYVQIARVSYQAHETSPEHAHPAFPTVYVYTTDGGPILFKHEGGEPVQRPAVKAGQIRFARPNAETHEVEYKGDQPTTYVRVELKTDPVKLPERDVRIGPDMPAAGQQKQEFENEQIRLVKLTCAAGQSCPASEHPGDPAVLVFLHSSRSQWLAPNAKAVRNAEATPTQAVRIELKSKPRS